MEKEDETRSRGFGFVEFDTLAEANAAIEGLNDTQLGNKIIMENLKKHTSEIAKKLNRAAAILANRHYMHKSSLIYLINRWLEER